MTLSLFFGSAFLVFSLFLQCDSMSLSSIRSSTTHDVLLFRHFTKNCEPSISSGWSFHGRRPRGEVRGPCTDGSTWLLITSVYLYFKTPFLRSFHQNQTTQFSKNRAIRSVALGRSIDQCTAPLLGPQLLSCTSQSRPNTPAVQPRDDLPWR